MKKAQLMSSFAAGSCDVALPYLQHRSEVRFSDRYILQWMKDPLGDIKFLDVFLGRLITEAFILLRTKDFSFTFSFRAFLTLKDGWHFSREDCGNIKLGEKAVFLAVLN